MSPQLRSFLKALMIDLTENHDWNSWNPELTDDEHDFFDVAEKHAHLIEDTWQKQRKDEIEHQIKQLTEELKNAVSKTPRTDKWMWEQECNYEVAWEDNCKELETELADMRESEQRYAKCFERIARAVGIDSPLVLMSMAESDEENYAEILARHIETRESKKEML